MMKSELFSGLNDLKASNELKRKILLSIKNDSVPAKDKPNRSRLRIALVAGFVMLIIAGISVGYRLLETYRDSFQNENGSLVTQVKSSPSSNAKFEILDSPPQIDCNFLMDYDPLSEGEVFRFADIIIFGQVKDFKWVKINSRNFIETLDTPNFYDYFRYQTIATVKVIKAYKGDIEMDDTLEILLPVIVYGNKTVGNKIWAEDNTIAQNLEIDSRAFFFARDNTGKRIYKDTWGFDLEDICKYSTEWGEEFIIAEKDDRYIYSGMFKTLQSARDIYSNIFEPSCTLGILENRSQSFECYIPTATFEEIEDMIEKYVK
ncbi:MAG: hypothetical protein GX383_12615 [Clostridium sp.]|nr:hypothetical protein [Clostridium sp.]